MVKLGRIKGKLATMLGDESEEYELHLADGTIGMIDGQGTFCAKF